MGRTRLLRGLVWAVGCGAVGAAISAAPARQAHADASSAGVTGAACVLKGWYPVAKGTQLFDAASGGRVLATFTGAITPLQMSDVPADPTSGRARVTTSQGSPTLRIEGYTAPSSIATFTVRDVPVAPGHVWIAGAQRVRLVKAAANALTAELTIAGSQPQTIRGSAGCEAFALEQGSATRFSVPGNGRGYLMKTATIDLYDAPGGSVVFTLRMADSGHLFWSTEARSGFVRVQSRADIAIDAWAKESALEAMKKGEMMDQLLPSSTAVTGAQLALEKPPPLVRAAREIPVRARRDPKERPIGAIEAGAEVYLVETMAGWTNVLPKGLWVTPPSEGGFWIPSSEAPR